MLLPGSQSCFLLPSLSLLPPTRSVSLSLPRGETNRKQKCLQTMLTLQKFCAFQVIDTRMRSLPGRGRNGLLEVYEVYDKLGSFPVCQSSI